ncbi:MAG: hypothetical protein KKB53_06460 [Acidobacteria bacterium]|nr:hypothetical protein [Acidobacteriota bacterium]
MKNRVPVRIGSIAVVSLLLVFILSPSLSSKNSSQVRRNSMEQEIPQLQHEAVAVNIEVPTRVFRGEDFVDDLTIDDFELTEDGVKQTIDAVYLIKKTNIERREEVEKRFAPEVARHFILYFEVQDYLPRLADAVDYFFTNVFLPGDSLSVVSPLTTYNIKAEALNRLPRDEIANQLIGKLKKDITLGAAPYKTLIREIEAMAGGGSEGALLMLRDLLMRIEQYRYIDENKLVAFAEFLKAKEGQKNVFLFYQKELLPQIDLTNPNILLKLGGNPENPGELLDLLEVTEHFKRDITFDVDRIQKLFSDSSILVHFLFLTKTKMVGLDVERQGSLTQLGVRYVDHSEDIYGAFNEVAIATGGFTTSSFNPESAFQKAVEATENYYLVYYTPKNYRTDGTFHTIKVNVKRKGLRVTHRSGYFAN